MAAGHADVLVLGSGTVEPRRIRWHDAVSLGVKTRRGYRRGRAQQPRTHVRDVRDGPHRVRKVPVQRLHRERHLLGVGGDAHRRAERDHAAHALRRPVRRVERVDAAQAPADQTHLASMPVMHVPQLLLERLGELALEPGVLPESPRLDLVSTRSQENTQRDERCIGRGEPRYQQHRVTVAARGRLEQRHEERQARQLEQPAPFEQRVDQPRRPSAALRRPSPASS